VGGLGTLSAEVCPQSIRDGGFRSVDERANGLRPQGGNAMLWTLFVVLLVLWLLGVVSSYTIGGFIHILLVLAVVALLIQLIQGRRVV
jgi:Family of unknown function (DUF5670)